MSDAGLSASEDQDIEAYHVSEDGVRWRPFDPVADRGRTLHRRIHFAAPREERAQVQPGRHH